jgi:hypothetical protein
MSAEDFTPGVLIPRILILAGLMLCGSILQAGHPRPTHVVNTIDSHTVALHDS